MALISEVLVLVIITALHSPVALAHSSREATNGSLLLFACESTGYQPGICVPLEQCPPLLQILTDGPHTAKNIRFLQRLTCGFETADRPLVCCPSADVNRNPAPLPLPSAQEETAEPLLSSLSLEAEYFPDLTQDFRTHPNFGLLPKITECGNRLDIWGREEANGKWLALDNGTLYCGAVGGTTVPLASYPWMALLGYRNNDTGSIEFKCGGSIINNRYILTAAHCLKDFPEIVRLGEHDTTTDEDCAEYNEDFCTTYTDFEVEEVTPHEHALKSNDIGLIRLAREISFDRPELLPICLPFPLEYGFNVVDVWKGSFDAWQRQGRLLTVTGWGKTRWDNQEGSTTLQEVYLPLVPVADCQVNYTAYTANTFQRHNITISTRQLCAGGFVDVDSCGGDSGGPLQVQVDNQCRIKVFQLGIVNFGPIQCGNGQIPGVYARVSSYRKWILDHIRP